VPLAAEGALAMEGAAQAEQGGATGGIGSVRALLFAPGARG